MTATDDFLAPFRTFWNFGPQQRDQQFLNGWSLINVTEQNSSRPETERAIVAEESYGRQIGRLTDAVLALIDERGAQAAAVPAFDELKQLAERVAKIKSDSAEQRVARLREDLEALKAARPDIYAIRIAELRALIAP